MSISNPSHLLISRNPPRSPAHPQLAPASTSRHANSPLPPAGLLGSWQNEVDVPARQRRHSLPSSTPEDTALEAEDVAIHPTFQRDAPLAGRVKVMVGLYEFWCHKEVLWFASPFFQGLLQGRYVLCLRSSALLFSKH